MNHQSPLLRASLRRLQSLDKIGEELRYFFRRVVWDSFRKITSYLSIISRFVYSLTSDSGQAVQAMEASIPRQNGTVSLIVGADIIPNWIITRSPLGAEGNFNFAVRSMNFLLSI